MSVLYFVYFSSFSVLFFYGFVLFASFISGGKEEGIDWIVGGGGYLAFFLVFFRALVIVCEEV